MARSLIVLTSSQNQLGPQTDRCVCASDVRTSGNQYITASSVNLCRATANSGMKLPKSLRISEEENASWMRTIVYFAVASSASVVRTFFHSSLRSTAFALFGFAHRIVVTLLRFVHRHMASLITPRFSPAGSGNREQERGRGFSRTTRADPIGSNSLHAFLDP